MNYAEIRLALRPRTIFEILDLALLVLRRSFVTLWPVYGVFALLWTAALLGVRQIPDGEQRSYIVFGALMLSLLLIRFFLQIMIVSFCGRWIFSEEVSLSSLWADRKEVGFWTMVVRGGWRFIKWLSGFGLLLPLWVVLVHRFFDYEYWLLERIKGKELSLRLRHFRSGRIFAFRMLHFAYQALFVVLMSFAAKIFLESATHYQREQFLSIELALTLLLAYEPFFLISRFLLYIQTRIDNEAWDVGLMLREGIQKTLKSKAVLLWIVSLSLFSLPLVAEEPGPQEAPPADRPCTDAMKEQPYVKCDPTAYRVYTAEEIEKAIPRQEERRKSSGGGVSPNLLENLSYGVVLVALVLLLLFLIQRYRSRMPEPPPAEDGKKAQAVEFEVMRKEDRLSLIREALQKGAWKAALGHSYLLLVERNEAAGSVVAALTPDELRLKLGRRTDVVDALLLRYEHVFYAGQAATEDVEATIRSFVDEMRGASL